MVRSMRDFVDNQFLDPTITAIAGTRPASILNGAPSTSSTGSTLAQIQTDLSGMTGQLTTWESPIWTMHPKTLTRLEIVGGGTLLRNNGAQPLLLGYPVFTSTASPAQIALIDAGNILLADGPVRVDFSDQVNVVLDDGGSPNELQFVNLWQTNLAGVLTELFINYERAYSGSAVYMAVAY
jgi:hypothetical protein